MEGGSKYGIEKTTTQCDLSCWNTKMGNSSDWAHMVGLTLPIISPVYRAHYLPHGSGSFLYMVHSSRSNPILTKYGPGINWGRIWSYPDQCHGFTGSYLNPVRATPLWIFHISSIFVFIKSNGEIISFWSRKAKGVVFLP